MLFYITGGAPQAVPGTGCVEANRTACTEDPCSSGDGAKLLLKAANTRITLPTPQDDDGSWEADAVDGP
jgi:hypothetical protein